MRWIKILFVLNLSHHSLGCCQSQCNNSSLIFRENYSTDSTLISCLNILGSNSLVIIFKEKMGAGLKLVWLTCLADILDMWPQPDQQSPSYNLAVRRFTKTCAKVDIRIRNTPDTTAQQCLATFRWMGVFLAFNYFRPRDGEGECRSNKDCTQSWAPFCSEFGFCRASARWWYLPEHWETLRIML